MSTHTLTHSLSCTHTTHTFNRFSAVVRQEVAPPPPAETTTFRPNGGVSSLSNENESVAPPPAAATVVGVNSIPKTDSSSTGSNNSSKSELLSDTGIQPVSGDSSTPMGLLDTPISAKDNATSAESAGGDNVEIKGQDTTVTTSEQVCLHFEFAAIWCALIIIIIVSTDR